MTKNASAKTSSKAKNKELDKKNLDKATKVAAQDRITKYTYPETAKDPLDRKKFRRGARATAAKLAKAVKTAKGADLDKAKKELEKFNKATYATAVTA